MKRCVIAVFLLFTSAYAAQTSQTVFLSKHFSSLKDAQQVLSKCTYFLFDIHGVLFDRGKYIKALKKIKSKKKFFKQGVKALFSKKTWAKYNKCKRIGNKITECKFDAAKDFKHLHQELIDFSNNIFSPNSQMLGLLMKLKNQGHSLYLCSNIGNVTLERLVAQHPTFFQVMSSSSNTINRTASETTDNFVWKPQAKAYEQALITIGKKAPQECIFVDDQIHNVKAAHAVGLTAIHYISYEQFFHDICALLELA